MKISDLYKREPVKINNDIEILVGHNYNHIDELTSEYINLLDPEEKNNKIEIKYYKDHCFDGRRVWTLASVWFDNNPVMVIQNAGREGDDHSERFITDENLYIEMLKYIKTLMRIEEKVACRIYNIDEDLDNLTNFHGYDLDNSIFNYYN